MGSSSQSLLNSLQSEKKEKIPSELNLIKLETILPESKGIKYWDINPDMEKDIQKKLEELEDKKKEIEKLNNEKKIKALQLEISKLKEELTKLSKSLREIKSANSSASINSISQFISENEKIVRECEVNYYMLERKLEDLKINHASILKVDSEKSNAVDLILKKIYVKWFEIERLKENFNLLKIELNTISKNPIDPNTDLQKLFINSEKIQSEIKSNIDSINYDFNNIGEEIKNCEKQIINSDESIGGILASPAINNIANKYSPSLTFQGTVKFGKSYNELGIFTGGLFGSNENTREGIYFPELSSFSIYYKGATTAIALNDENKKMGLNYEIYYMNKKDSGDILKDIKAFDYQAMQLKVGFEFVVYKEVISIYGNLNLHLPITKINNLKLILNENRTDQVNFDLGVRMLLNPSNQNSNSTKLFIDLNAMILNTTMRRTIGISDAVLPNLKIGIQQKLTKF